MERWDLVQSASDQDDASWIEDVADEALGEGEAKERFLQQVLSPATKARRDFRDSLRKLVSPHQDSAIIQISRKLGYLVSWPPITALSIGDVGTFDNVVSFVKQANIRELGVGFQNVRTRVIRVKGISEAAGAVELNCVTGDVSTIRTDTGVRYEFARGGTAFFQASGARRRQASIPLLENQVQELVRQEKWQKDWNVVAETVEASQVLFFIANEDAAAVEFTGDPGSVRPEETGEPPRIIKQHGMRATFVAGQGAVPLFQTVKLNRSGRLDRVRTF
jgi:hypothetical protein